MVMKLLADDVGRCPFCELNAADVVTTSEFAIAFSGRYLVAISSEEKNYQTNNSQGTDELYG